MAAVSGEQNTMKRIHVLIDKDGDTLAGIDGEVIAFRSKARAEKHAETLGRYTHATLPADGGWYVLHEDLGVAV